MKKKIMALALLLTGLTACNNQEELITPGEHVPEGYAGMTFSLATSKDVRTKAVGDALSSALTTEEKDIKSIAFFVDIHADGFRKYLSTEGVGTTNGLFEDLKATTTEGEYTAKLRIQGDQFGASDVVVIANYAQNGLTDALKNVTSRTELEAVMQTALTDNPQNPLLMYDAQAITLVSGQTHNASYEMKRMVARIDIRNLAEKTPATDGFVLTSARLVNAKTGAYLVPHATVSDIEAIPVATFSACTPKVGTPTQIDTLYTYENPNTTNATALEVIGTFRGLPAVKLVKFEQMQQDGTMKTIAIERNKRYVVEITPAPDSTSVDMNISVVDWAAADTFRVKPISVKPILKGITVTSGNAIFDATTKTLDITSDKVGTAQKLTFTAEGTQEMIYEVAYRGNTTKGDWVTVDESAVSGYATENPLSKVYTVDISAYSDADNIGLRRALLIIKNKVKPTERDTIQILQKIPYVDSNAPSAVLVGGIWWAPMNCGATVYDVTTPIVAGDLTVKHGKLYQWGRKYGFANTNDPLVYNADTANVADIGWPTETNYKDLDNFDSPWYQKFIISGTPETHGVDMKGNWLRINPAGDNPESANMVADAWYQRLWNENEVAGTETTPKKSVYDPCPDGWRVPTSAEWKLIGVGKQFPHISWDASAKYCKIEADTGGSPLYLPAVGNRDFITGASKNQAAYGQYWSSSNRDDNSPLVYYIYFSGAKLSSGGTDGRSSGFSVRCVQE